MLVLLNLVIKTLVTVSCDDYNACTEDGCDCQTGCYHNPISCDDYFACTEETSIRRLQRIGSQLSFYVRKSTPIFSNRDGYKKGKRMRLTRDVHDRYGIGILAFPFATGTCSNSPKVCDDGIACT